MVLGLASLASVILIVFIENEKIVLSHIAGFIFAVIAAGLYGVDKPMMCKLI